jgi:type IV pilus assembly protein PilN
MIRINLLPHREEKRKARRIQFFVLVGLVSVLAGLIVFLGYTIVNGYIASQDERNEFLKKEIAVLDKQIEEIKRLKEQTQWLLSRKQVIESLQADRAEAVYLLNEMVKQVPEGVYLKSLKQDGRKVSLNGYTQSNARVLVEIKTATVDKRRVSEFSMTVMLSRAPAAATDKSNVAAGKDKK